ALEEARDFRNRGSAEPHELAARELPDLRGQDIKVGKRLWRRFPRAPLGRACQVVVVVSHLAHQLLGHAFMHLVGETAQLFCAPAPMRRIIVGHGHSAPVFLSAERSWRKPTDFRSGVVCEYVVEIFSFLQRNQTPTKGRWCRACECIGARCASTTMPLSADANHEFQPTRIARVSLSMSTAWMRATRLCGEPITASAPATRPRFRRSPHRALRSRVRTRTAARAS